MKILQIAFKDMKQAFRSLLGIAFMFLVPILITGMFALIFGGGDEEESSGFDLPVISVWVVNQDPGEMGEAIIDILLGDDFADLLDVTIAEEPDQARAAVDNQEADAAVILPRNLESALYTPGVQAEIEIYQDPTLELGSGIITTIVNHLADGFSGAAVVVSVAGEQLAQAGMPLSNQQTIEIVERYQTVVTELNSDRKVLRVETPSGEVQSNHGVANTLAMVMGGMMIFYTFFTGTNSANSLLTEEDNRTLGRMLTTATLPVQVVAGKLVAGAIMVAVQTAVLLAFGSLVFGIYWGELWLLALLTIGLSIGANTFGLFAISWAKDRRQASLIVGGGVTITGMLGISSIFMMNSPNPNQAINSLSLFVPQGWANRALIHIMDGFSVPEVLLSLLGLLVYSAVLFFIGYKRFMKRFA